MAAGRHLRIPPVRTSAKTGNPLYEQPSVLVLYRGDQRFVLDAVIPRKGACDIAYDLVIAAQPYRARPGGLGPAAD